MFAFGERRRDNGIVKMIRGGDMHNAHVRIVDQCLVAAVAFPCSKLLCLPLSRFIVAAGHRYDIHKAQAPHCIDVMRSNKAGTNDSHPNSCLFCHARNYSARFSADKAWFLAEAESGPMPPSSKRSDTSPLCRRDRRHHDRPQEHSSPPAEWGRSLPSSL